MSLDYHISKLTVQLGSLGQLRDNFPFPLYCLTVNSNRKALLFQLAIMLQRFSEQLKEVCPKLTYFSSSSSTNLDMILVNT